MRLRDLLDMVEAPLGRDVAVTSLQERGAFRASLLQGNFADDDRTLLALQLNGEPLALDHGFPARIIAPGVAACARPANCSEARPRCASSRPPPVSRSSRASLWYQRSPMSEPVRRSSKRSTALTVRGHS